MSTTVIVLTGGASRRMGSHKPVLDVGGQPLVARVLAAAQPWPSLVVGPRQGVPEGVPTQWEPVPGGGPAAGLAVGIEAWADAGDLPEVVVVLAADLPFLTHAHLERLVQALDAPARPDLAVTVDPSGRRNWLCAAWRAPVLRERLSTLGDAYGHSMRELSDGLRVVPVDDPDDVALDVDTPADLDRARRRSDGA